VFNAIYLGLVKNFSKQCLLINIRKTNFVENNPQNIQGKLALICLSCFEEALIWLSCFEEDLIWLSWFEEDLIWLSC
jgi:hypothetical protein